MGCRQIVERYKITLFFFSFSSFQHTIKSGHNCSVFLGHISRQCMHIPERLLDIWGFLENKVKKKKKVEKKIKTTKTRKNILTD